jgi:small subunit ribosomal protein S6
MSAHKYELMMIVDPQLEDASVKKLVDGYLDVVKNAKGSIDKTDFWGRRKLAYEIDGNTEGSYVVVNYSVDPATNDELKRQLGLAPQVIRTKILRKDN